MVSVRVSTHAQLGLIPGNSRKISFPKVPGNFWGFLCTEKRKLRIFTQFSPTFLDFSFALKSNFIVKKDEIQVKNHCNSSKNCIFSQNRMFSNIYIVIPANGSQNFGNSRSREWRISGNLPTLGPILKRSMIRGYD